MSARLRTVSTAALFSCLVAVSAVAQDALLPASAPPPANLAFVEGVVDLVHEGALDRAAGGTMLVDGDLIRTANGRAEIVFADGTLFHLDHDTDLELLSPLRLRLRGGRVMLRVSAAATAAYVIDTHAASVRLDPRGEYGLTADGRLERLELTVARGVAEVDDAGTRTIVRGGEMATILGAGGRVLLQAFNSARWDAFERWSNDRTNGFSTAVSARQLPHELRAYGPVLDSYGRWDNVAPYGNVWFPAVGAGWRPYYTGAWTLTRYGWTWIGHDPWAWPTHHFGRWGFTGAAWYWIPTRVWGPAWVSWSFMPGYVSWCPLGWDGRAVVGFSQVSTWLRGGPSTLLGAGRWTDHPDFWPNFDPWNAWTIVPRDSFGARRPVRTHAVDPTRLPEETRRAMVGHAVPRDPVSVPTATRVPPPGTDHVDYAVPREEARPRGGARNPSFAPVPPSVSPPPAPAVAPPTIYYPPTPSYDRGGAERRSALPRERRADDPPPSRASDRPEPVDGRVYTPPAYAVPRGERPRSRYQEPPPAASTPPPGDYAKPSPSTAREPQGRSEEGRWAPSPGESGGRVRSPAVASPPTSGESQAGPPPRQSSGSEGHAQGGAVRRRPPQ